MTSATLLYDELHQLLLSKEGEHPSTIDLNKYLGSPQKLLYISTPTLKTISANFSKDHKEIAAKTWISLFDQLAKSPIHEERIIIGHLITRLKGLASQIPLKNIEEWLEGFSGWNQIDCLCSGVFSASLMLDNWNAWEPFLESLNHSSSISKRRASLVLLTHPVNDNPMNVLAKTAFANTLNLLSDNDVLITKAISWILRSLIKHHRSQVDAFLIDHEPKLPTFVLREVRHKLITGTKI